MEPGSANEVSYGAWVGSGGGDPGPVDPGPVNSGGDPAPVSGGGNPAPDGVSFEFDGSSQFDGSFQFSNDDVI